ncbi:MAG: urea ABC transporter ATP-binding subunit UrtE [Anaerolineae bacterium]|nr:urea ABC transporter ATP-binding subunit UrtE [Anaerolineales bacterium]MCQ3976011.1 urea ABC transporter ATP-binding subunit UrtE [Anaerolineae bacterium]
MLKVEHLQTHYGESRILNDVSLEVTRNEVVCLLGRNGVGKTTFMKSVMGTIRTRQGEIKLAGENLSGYPASQRARAGIGYVPQGRGIFPYLTVYENLLMGFERVPRQKLDLSAIEEMYTLFPVLKDMRRRVAGTLSGGQQQQLAIARALVSRPKLLLLDEPTEGIQPSIMLEIEQVILTLQDQGGIAILVVEQFLDFALQVADYFYIMETGTIVKEGPIEEFNDEVARTYLAV